MLSFLGYNFFSDGNSLDPYPTSLENITNLTIQNGIYDEVYLTKDTIEDYSTIKPTDWGLYTILLAQFEGNLDGGNLAGAVQQMDSIRIKRRKVGEFDWVTLKVVPINTAADLSFVGEDLYAEYDTDYEYAWVPVLNGIEGNYVTAEITSKFNGVFIADADTIYKFYAGVTYGSAQSVQQVGMFTPLNQKYPIYVANSQTDFMTGSISGQIMGRYEDTHEFNRKEMVQERDALLKFLKNKKPKIIKDDNGNQWLVFITGTPSVSFDARWGNGMMNVSFDWGEVGDSNDTQDLQNAGLAPIV